jgi:hypothetical protein
VTTICGELMTVPAVNERLARAQAAGPDVFLPKLARQLEILARDAGLFCAYHDTKSLAYVRDLLDVLAPIVRGDIELGSETTEAIDSLVALLNGGDDGR